MLAERIADRVELQAVSAGHPLPLVLRHGTGALEELGAPGSPLGILPEIDLREASTTLRGGDVLVLYTDGVTEARYRDGEGVVHQFSEEHLRSVVSGARGGRAADVAAAVEASVMQFQTGRRADDLAVLVLRATGGNGAGTA